MLSIAPNPAITGAELRRIVAAEPTAPHAAAIRRIGNLDVQLVRREQRWKLYLADLQPIAHTTRDQWATAVSAPVSGVGADAGRVQCLVRLAGTDEGAGLDAT